MNAFSLDGDFVPLTVTDRLTAEPPAFGVALAHAWPSEHDRRSRAPPTSRRAAAEALGIRNGPSYTQVRLGPDGPVVMEVAARLGGGHDAELCRAALGVDLNALAVEAALGERSDAMCFGPHELCVGGALRRLPRAARGGSSRSRASTRRDAGDGVEWVRVYRRPGHVFGAAAARRGPRRSRPRDGRRP